MRRVTSLVLILAGCTNAAPRSTNPHSPSAPPAAAVTESAKERGVGARVSLGVGLPACNALGIDGNRFIAEFSAIAGRLEVEEIWVVDQRAARSHVGCESITLRADGSAICRARGRDEPACWGRFAETNTRRRFPENLWIKTAEYRYDYHRTDREMLEVDKTGVQSRYSLVTGAAPN